MRLAPVYAYLYTCYKSQVINLCKRRQLFTSEHQQHRVVISGELCMRRCPCQVPCTAA